MTHPLEVGSAHVVATEVVQPRADRLGGCHVLWRRLREAWFAALHLEMGRSLANRALTQQQE